MTSLLNISGTFSVCTGLLESVHGFASDTTRGGRDGDGGEVLGRGWVVMLRWRSENMSEVGLQVRPFFLMSVFLEWGGEMGVRNGDVCGEWKLIWRVEREAGIWAGRDSRGGALLFGWIFL